MQNKPSDFDSESKLTTKSSATGNECSRSSDKVDTSSNSAAKRITKPRSGSQTKESDKSCPVAQGRVRDVAELQETVMKLEEEVCDLGKRHSKLQEQIANVQNELKKVRKQSEDPTSVQVDGFKSPLPFPCINLRSREVPKFLQ